MRLSSFVKAAAVCAVSVGARRLVARGSLSYDDAEGLITIISNITQSQTQQWLLNFTSLVNETLGVYDEEIFFLSGNVCSWPSNAVGNISALDEPNADYSLDTSNDIALYYSFDPLVLTDQSTGNMALFEDGHFGAIVEFVDNSTASTLYVVVKAPQNTNILASWDYELAVSFDMIIFQWDNLLWGNVIDTTNSAALIGTGNLTQSGFLSDGAVNLLVLDPDSLQTYDYLNVLNHEVYFKRDNAYSQQQFRLYIFDYKDRDYFNGYSHSWCAVTRGPTIIDPIKINATYVTRNGLPQQQFYVEGLNSSTTYFAFIAGEFNEYSEGILAATARLVYAPFEFTTQSTPACEMIYDLDFCKDVAYSVPAKEDVDRHALGQMYDDYAASLYTNFSKALQQVPCQANQDSIFSPLRTCGDCEYSYRQWLCSVTIPRCSTMDHPGYKLRAVGELRNDFVNDVILPVLPYYELLPCIDVCERLVRDCPASLGFQCPSIHQSLQFSESYYTLNRSAKYQTCNWVGMTVTSGGSGLSSGLSLFIMIPLAIVCFLTN